MEDLCDNQRTLPNGYKSEPTMTCGSDGKTLDCRQNFAGTESAGISPPYRTRYSTRTRTGTKEGVPGEGGGIFGWGASDNPDLASFSGSNQQYPSYVIGRFLIYRIDRDAKGNTEVSTFERFSQGAQ